MPSKNEKFTLEENLALTNKELTSNWSKLASLITAYEGTSWNASRKKAINLLATGKAIAYIEEVREDVKQHPQRLTEPPKEQTAIHIQFDELSVYERNYDLLMEIAPELEERLANLKKGDYIYGKSKLTGTRDFNIDFVDKDKDGFYLALCQYSMMNGDLFGDPDMEIRVDLKNRVIEALHYQDQFNYDEVYTDKRERKAVFPDEKKRQNDVLSGWLKKLKKQGHKVVFVDPEEEDTSEIIDHYKKGDRVEEKKQGIKADKPTKSDPKEEEKKEAKIISFPKENAEQRHAGLKKFISIVAFSEIGTHVKDVDDLEERVKHILDHQGASDYLVNAWGDLQKESHERLKELNFYRLIFLAPDIHDLLNDSGEKLRLVSEKSKEVFSIELGDNRNKSAKTLAVYQLQGKDDIPTLLLKVNEQKNILTVDLALNQFMKMSTFNADDETNTDLEPYQASIEVENWLKFLRENEYRVIVTDLKPEKGGSGEESPVVQVEEKPEEEPHEYDNDYINKDIPDFEPGHVQLTETHKKYGVTQKVINEINRTQKGKVIFPRAKAMIHNTKDKLADLAHQAQMPGFRISKTGKFYFEGRSNRADRTRSGY